MIKLTLKKYKTWEFRVFYFFIHITMLFITMYIILSFTGLSCSEYLFFTVVVNCHYLSLN